MFFYLLVLLLIAAAVHCFRLEQRDLRHVGEIVLLYVLVGYCGMAMLVVSIGILGFPEKMAEMLPVGPSTAIVAFFGWAYLAMSVMSLLAIKYRGSYLVGPAIAWAIYFAGATAVHLVGPAAPQHMTHGGALTTFVTHGLISVLLVAGLVASGELKKPRTVN